MLRARRIGALAVGLLLFGALFVAAVPAADHAETDHDSEVDPEVEHVIETYNDNIDKAPDSLQSLLSDERVELRIGDGDAVASEDSGDAYFVVLGDDARVVDYGDGPAEDPTVRVMTSEATVDRIVESNRPADTAVEAYDNDEIQVEGVGFVNTVKIESIKTAIWIVRTAGAL